MASANVPTKLPAILLANDLLDGDVVFWTGTGWTRNPAEARVAHDEAGAALLDEAGKAADSRNEVVDQSLVDVTLSTGGIPVPNHFRERFKVSGPSIRPDLGKQAEFGRT